MDNKRKQQYVKIEGEVERRLDLNNPYSLRERRVLCKCLLAPELPAVDASWKSGYWCREDCHVKIHSREYVNCSEKELLKYLIDFPFLHMNPEEIIGAPGNTIAVEETESRDFDYAAYV